MCRISLLDTTGHPTVLWYIGLGPNYFCVTKLRLTFKLYFFSQIYKMLHLLLRRNCVWGPLRGLCLVTNLFRYKAPNQKKAKFRLNHSSMKLCGVVIYIGSYPNISCILILLANRQPMAWSQIACVGWMLCWHFVINEVILKRSHRTPSDSVNRSLWLVQPGPTIDSAIPFPMVIAPLVGRSLHSSFI